MKRYLQYLWILVPVIAIALSSCSKGGNELVGPEGTEDGATILKKGGGGKPPKDPPPPADPAIAYTDIQSNPHTLMVMNADGSNQTEVFSSSDLGGQYTWSRDGASIAFMMNVAGTSGRELWRIDVTIVDSVPQGSNAHVLTDNIYYAPAWSPAGDVIAFTKRIFDPSVGRDEPREIRTIPAAGGAETTLYTAPEGHRVVYLTWRSDATQIAFREQIGVSQYWIKILTIADPLGPENPKTVFGPVDYSLAHLDWARTKDVLACMANLDEITAIYTLDITQQNPTLQFVIGGESRTPSWSPDDSKLAFDQPDRVKNGRVFGWHVRTYDFATGETAKLASGVGPDWRRCDPCP
jgi:dipeptidyl aminopeptidase/acylaminoacyl peptidase